MGNARFVSFASAVSEIQQSDIFMTVKSRMLETPKANLNGVRVTPAFVDEIIANEERYATLPLYADVRSLKSGKYNRLGHLYDAKTGEFHSTQIGSFYKFEKEEFAGGCYLVGYARIPKRDKALAKAIAELFAENALKFSFEISCAEYTELDDGTFEIDASENNFLEGTAIVTFPACEDAVALELVAQRQADAQERGETEMAEGKEVVAEEAVETQVETAEAAQSGEPVEEVAETQETEPKAETAEEQVEACEDKRENAEVSDTETAAVYVDTVHREEEEIHAYDTDTGVNVDQCVEVTTRVSHVEPDAKLVEAEDGIHIAEADNAEEAIAETEDAEEGAAARTETTAETAAENTKKAGGESEEAPGSAAADDVPAMDDNAKKLAEQIQELAEAVKTLTAEVAELKEAKKVVASKSVTAEINPFVDNINAGPKYGLLEKYGSTGNYTLLGR